MSQLDLDQLRAVVAEQANDAGLWFDAQTAPEAYLQAALRRLHAVIEVTEPVNGSATKIPLAGDKYFIADPYYLSQLGAAYPMVEIEQTLKEIRIWCLSNPSRCKTKRGVKRFINGWFAKEQKGD